MIAVGARDKTARLASSDAWDMWAVKPCFAAILQRLDNGDVLMIQMVRTGISCCSSMSVGRVAV